jgi:hypothetical protein
MWGSELNEYVKHFRYMISKLFNLLFGKKKLQTENEITDCINKVEKTSPADCSMGGDQAAAY